MGSIVDGDTTAVSAVINTTAGAGGLVVGVGDEDAADAGAVGIDWADGAGKVDGNMTTAGIDGVVDNTVDGDATAVSAVINTTAGAGGL